MNATKRLIFGVLSCLLLAAGLVRAADHFDPSNYHQQLTDKEDNSGLGYTMPCQLPDSRAD